jgi:hypothetical protein
MRFAVLCKGVLRGMGREAVCELLATKTVLPEASRAIYSHCAIIDSPKDLPDGNYEVEFAGEVAVTSLHAGSWMVGRILPRTLAEAAAFYATDATKAVLPVETIEPRPDARRTRAGRKPA